MTSKEIRHIICAVRGHPHAREKVTKAIDLALEHKARLTFFLVIDMTFMGQAMPAMTSIRAVYSQLEQMGEFTMQILCDRAERRGVEQVSYVIRRGNIPDELIRFAHEREAQIMVLGRPIISMGRSVFTPEEFDAFVNELEEETGIQVVQVVHEDFFGGNSAEGG